MLHVLYFFVKKKLFLTTFLSNYSCLMCLLNFPHAKKIERGREGKKKNLHDGK